MLLLFLPHPSPPLLPPAASRTRPPPRLLLPPIHASPSPELLAKSALRRISDKLRSLGYLEADHPEAAPGPAAPEAGAGASPGEIFVPTPAQLPRHRVGSTLDPSWATGDGEGAAASRRRRRGGRDSSAAASAPPSAAELALPRDELRRLQGAGIRLRNRLKVGKAGVTEGIVNGIHERWRNAELVKIRCDDVSAMNMKRTHEILERKTGGLVIWRSGSTIILYRGTDYKYPYFHDREMKNDMDESSEHTSSDDEDADLAIIASEQSGSEEDSDNPAEHGSNHTEEGDDLTRRFGVDALEGNLDIGSAEQSINSATKDQQAILHTSTNVSRPSEISGRARSTLVAGVGSPNKFRLQLPGEVKLAEEADKLLDGLGPRFSDWWGYDPLPVDADLLPAIVPGYRRPFRLLPSGVPPRLTDREMTILRRLARPLPYHYALGRSSNLQGLAASMIKLWERCEVAKVAIKRGAENIDSDLISEKLKGLTGGTLLSRDNESIVFYRGKDFLPTAVSLAIEKRRKYGNSTISNPKLNFDKSTPQNSSKLKMATDVSLDGHECYEKKHKDETAVSDNRAESLNVFAQNVEARLSQAIAEKEKTEKLIEELEMSSEPSRAETREVISEEERYMLRKVGLKMKSFLLLGRRGVFDGTVENMHLHWKYRELVKIICKEHNIKDVEYAARTLEAESGGILVAVERVSKAHAIIIYRGKNYQRPSTLRPKSLLNKKDALKRSVEYQRYKSLKLHVLNLSKNIDYLKDQMFFKQMEVQPVTPTNGMNSGHHNQGILDLNVNSGTLVDKKEEVSEVLPECAKSVVVECSSGESETEGTSVLTKSGVPLDVMQNKLLCFSKHTDDLSETTSSCLTESTSTSSESTHQSPLSSSVMHNSDSHRLPSAAAPLSNRERLMLRKQALKMKKRPVLAVGRNNVITGVAKAIKTHFKKHPLAIVNIKNRADGTPIQQLISELEEATGSVLVSREPNKVILYRGWGADVAQNSLSGNNSTEQVEKEVISPQLLEAVRLECGLHPGESE
ncbi:CRM-domain containing factor CFM2, chloroplastic isoform X3 [Oryza sativa Japonica Group]|uniref:CRM-domain containing factor CFM2, chloroplastic isoform X3 n=1 Tax=Oryza sativa subsp. japonica TaxID=39947 RepID=UPI000775367B|nr:CRM-domain containing factor CFM2, chloroplastic isoform X3 [Oryza sativa Japonica Group]